MRDNTLAVLLIAALALALGCGSKSTTVLSGWAGEMPYPERELGPIDPTDLHVLVALPFSRPGPVGTPSWHATRSHRHLAAISMAVDELQRSGDLLDGRRIRLVVVDVTDDSEEAVIRIEQARAELHAAGARFAAALTVGSRFAVEAVQAGVPVFDLTAGMGWPAYFVEEAAARSVYLAAGSARLESRFAARFLLEQAEDRGWNKLLLIRGTFTSDYVPAVEVSESVLRMRRARGCREHDEGPGCPLRWVADLCGVVSAGIQCEYTTEPEGDVVVDYDGLPKSEVVRRLRRLDDGQRPDVIYLSLAGEWTNEEFLREAARQSLGIPIVTAQRAAGPELLTSANAEWLSYHSGRLWFSARAAFETERLASFREEFEAYASMAPDSFAASAYDAMAVVGLGIASAGSTDPAELERSVPAVSQGGTLFGHGQLAAAVQAARAGQDIDYDGASGPFDISELVVPSWNEGRGVVRQRTVAREYRLDELIVDEEGVRLSPVDGLTVRALDIEAP